MFEKLKKDKNFRTWVLLATYVVFITGIMLNFMAVYKWIVSLIWVFQPFFYALVFAFILNIPMVFIETKIQRKAKVKGLIHRKSRSISIVITLIIAVIVLLLLGFFIIPTLVDSIIQILNNVSGLLTGFFKNIDSILKFFNIDISLLNITNINDLINLPWTTIFSNILTLLGTTTGGVVSVLGSFGATLAWAFAGFMLSLYLLEKKETYLLQFRKVMVVFMGADKAKPIFNIAHTTNHIFKSFIGGQLMDAFIQAGMYWIAFKILGFPFAELMATIIAIMALVPVIGPTLSMVVNGVLLLTVSNPIFVIFYVVLYQVLQLFDNNFIYPRVVGSQVGLPGIWVLLSIFVFGSLFGVLGMLTAVPATAVLYVLLGKYVHTTLRAKKITVTMDDVQESDQ